jgi:hypothetical protein
VRFGDPAPWAESNLAASCAPRNYGGGSRVRADNERQRIEQLEEVIVEQDPNDSAAF